MTLLHIAILCILISIVCIEIGLHGIKVVVWIKNCAPVHPSFYRICTSQGYLHPYIRYFSSLVCLKSHIKNWWGIDAEIKIWKDT